jgi:hypothetical protein
MNRPETEAFPAGVARRLKTYVYRLIDPRNGETFYIGKGHGNRVFSHIRAEPDLEGDDLDNKVKRIRDIRLAGFEVAHVIHRHGMDDKTAFEVESALIDAYPGLTNIVGGAGGNDYGAMHAQEIISRYCAEPAVFQHKALLISVNRSATETSLYEATRYAWKIRKSTAEQAEVVLATRQGEIVGAFIPHRWLQATVENFPGRDPIPGRFGFEGEDAPEDIKKLYVGKRVPDQYRKHGAANPIKYTWKIISRHCAEPAVFQHKALLISVNRSATEASLYEATRYAWRIRKSTAEQAEVVLATRQGEIVGAFIAHRWLQATAENFPGRDPIPGRFGFEGEDAPEDIKKLYVGKRVPDQYRKHGAANPIKYTW